ncbi:MAG: hypothetical protein H7177_05260 [Rhizobacter sp.]|nr:hypothetical protein [Bacteriovorax sp.]
MKKTLGLLLLAVSLPAFAALPSYSAPEILARANIGAGFNLPEMSFISNTCPVINNRGDVSFKLMAFGGENNQGLWLKLGSEENGKIVYTAPDMRLLTEPSLNDKGQVAFNQYDEGITDGIFTIDGDTNNVQQVLKPVSDDIAYYTYPQVLTNGKVYFRATNQDSVRSYYQYDGSLKQIISEGVSSYGQKSSYLFKPYLNDSGAMTFKRRIGEAGEWDERNPDEILLLKPKGNSYESVVIAKDKDGDHDSKFLGFTNSTSLSKSGLIAFTAILEDTSKAIILSQDGKLKNLAIEKADNISEIELFAPKVNDQGLVVFRAKDMEGKRGIYITGAEGTKKLIGEGDEIMTDLGLAKILSNPNFPGFGGDVDMNDHGEIVFYCLVMGAKNNEEWGSAVFKITPQK